MQGVNRADIRKELKVSTIRNKIEKAHLTRICQILRLSDDRLVKQAVLGWNQDLEDLHKRRKKCQTTVGSWQRLLKEAVVELESVEKLVLKRKEWKEMIQNRMKFLQSFDEHKGKNTRKSQGRLISLRGARKSKKTKSDVFMKDVGDFFVQKLG